MNEKIYKLLIIDDSPKNILRKVYYWVLCDRRLANTSRISEELRDCFRAFRNSASELHFMPETLRLILL